MAITPAQFAQRARGFANDLPKVERRAVGAAALVVKNSALTELRSAVGPDLRMSGVGKRGAKVGARYDQAAGSASALVRATGPVHLIENDTKPHKISPKRRRGSRGALSIPGVGVRASVNHPGTRGKKPWAKAVAKARPKVGGIVAAETNKAMRGAFGR